MRAKFQVSSVEPFASGEVVSFVAVTSKPFDKDGVNEDNSFARFTPSADCKMTILNPTLLGKFAVGQTYYADFTSAD